MSGTGVQSAMRRRTRPPDEPRRDLSSQNRVTNTQSNTSSNNNQPQSRQLNIQQVIYMQEAKIQNIMKRLETTGINTTDNNTNSNQELKAEIEESINKKISLLNNNLNFILNGLNDERNKINTLNTEIDKLRVNGKIMLDKLQTKLDYDEFIEFKTNLENKEDKDENKEDKDENITTDEVTSNVLITNDNRDDNNDNDNNDNNDNNIDNKIDLEVDKTENTITVDIIEDNKETINDLDIQETKVVEKSIDL